MSTKQETEKLVKTFYRDIVAEAESTNKATAARRFKISLGAVDSAFYRAGKPERCSRWYIQMKGGIKPNKTPEVSTITWDQVLKVIPDKTTLAFLLIDGFIGRIKSLSDENQSLKNNINELKKEYSILLEDRKALMIEYNKYLSKEKTGGHFTLDETLHILIPKEK